MTPRISGSPAKRAPRRSFEAWRDGDVSLETRAFWNYATAPAMEGADVSEALPQEEFRVLSKAASGGGFLVPTDVGEMIIAAARAASAVAQVATEIVTETGDTFGVAMAGTHGAAAWTAESAAYTTADETITQQNMGAFKSASKIVVSEELRTDEAVSLDQYLAFELGARLGALQENAFSVADGSGKPLGIVHASSPYSVTTAATGSSTSYKLADLVAVFKALPLAYRANASWLINGDDFASLAALVDSSGGLVLPSLQFDPPSLFGRPVYVSGDLPAPAANAKSLALGDWKRAYCVRRVQAIGLQRQDELLSDNGQIAFKAFARVDGRPLLAAAAVILAHSAT